MGEGFVLSKLSVGEHIVELTEEAIGDTQALWGSIPGGSTVHLEFTRPPMEIPFHGSCRKGIHKSTNPHLTKEQTTWLTTTIFDSNHRVRDKEATNLMAYEFGGWYHPKTRQPLWLSQDQIASWISRNVAARKKATPPTSESTAAPSKKSKGTEEEQAGQGKKKSAGKRTRSPNSDKGPTSSASKPPADQAAGEQVGQEPSNQRANKRQKKSGNQFVDDSMDTVGDVIDLSAGLDME